MHVVGIIIWRLQILIMLFELHVHCTRILIAMLELYHRYKKLCLSWGVFYSHAIQIIGSVVVAIHTVTST